MSEILVAVFVGALSLYGTGILVLQVLGRIKIVFSSDEQGSS